MQYQVSAITTLEAVEKIGHRVMVTGVRQISHHSRTAKGESMLFPDAYRAAKSLVRMSAPLLVTGIMEMDSENGEPFLRVERVVMV